MIIDNKVCSYCVMDTTVPDIFFDNKHQCQYCKNHIERIKNEGKISSDYLNNTVNKIKEKSNKNAYDCIIGVSGGVDSTFVAYYLKRVLNLNPLAVHLDNGWNSELAVENIRKCLDELDIDLVTHVIDWKEFKSIQKALLKSSINNLEIATDHAIHAILIKTAAKKKINFIINGNNTASEGIMPLSWMESNHNKSLITSIYKKFYPNNKIRSLPTISLIEFFYYLIVKRIKYIPLLNFIKYDKKEAINILQREVGYKPYVYKHYESIITRFFQGYILPKKFNIDKRKAHFSSLIVSKQMTREDALIELKNHPYGDISLMEQDKKFFLKKLDISESEFQRIIEDDSKPATIYAPKSIALFNYLYKFSGFIRKITR